MRLMYRMKKLMFLRFTSKQIYRIFYLLVYFVCHTPKFKMLVFAFHSEIWIAQYFNCTVFKDFCLSLSWKYWFSQNVNHSKVWQTNKYGKFHVDLTRRRLSKSWFLKLGMVLKKTVSKRLKVQYFIVEACLSYIACTLGSASTLNSVLYNKIYLFNYFCFDPT